MCEGGRLREDANAMWTRYLRSFVLLSFSSATQECSYYIHRYGIEDWDGTTSDNFETVAVRTEWPRPNAFGTGIYTEYLRSENAASIVNASTTDWITTPVATSHLP